MARRALGRGLGSLIGGSQSVPPSSPEKQDGAGGGSGVMELPLASVVPSPWQPRKVFDEDKLHDLADSIRQQGLVQPVVVRKKGEKYELIAGERRFRAIESLDWKTVPAVVMEASDEKVRELALVENLQRDDLNPIEIATAYEALRGELGLTHEQIGTHIGVSRANVTNTLRLLELPEEVKRYVSSGELSAGHARALLGLTDGVSQIRMAKKTISEGLSVRGIERLMAARNKPVAKEKAAPGKDGGATAQIRDIEDRLRDHLGTKVSINDKKGRGVIEIEYYNPADVARILEKMQVPGDPS